MRGVHLRIHAEYWWVMQVHFAVFVLAGYNYGLVHYRLGGCVPLERLLWHLAFVLDLWGGQWKNREEEGPSYEALTIVVAGRRCLAVM